MRIISSLMRKLASALRLRPGFLIIGAQKSGTGALHHYLSQHPDLMPAKVKEIDFFSGDAKFSRGLDYYHNYFPPRNARSVIAYETSPSYLHNSNAAQRIHQYNSKLKLIAVLRDPAQRAFSAWKMYAGYFSEDRDWYVKWMVRCNGESWNKSEMTFRTPQTIADFGAYIEQELEVTEAGGKVEAPVVSHGFYHQQIERYTSFYPKNQIFLVTSDDLVLRTARVLSRIETFLNVSAHDWTQADLSPMFVGGARGATMPDNIQSLLAEYYRADGELLRCHYGVSFGQSSTGLVSYTLRE